jgi:hypothetical protein
MNTLFETRTDEDIRREAVADNGARVHDALVGRGPWQLSQRQRQILEALRGRQGRLQAMPISDLVIKLDSDPRSIKGDVRELVMNFRLPIVASRDSDLGGYFFATTAEERISGSADDLKQAVAMLERVRIIRNLPDLNALWGQLSIGLAPQPREE